jgi:hypothetical protein
MLLLFAATLGSVLCKLTTGSPYHSFLLLLLLLLFFWCFFPSFLSFLSAISAKKAEEPYEAKSLSQQPIREEINTSPGDTPNLARFLVFLPCSLFLLQYLVSPSRGI